MHTRARLLKKISFTYYNSASSLLTSSDNCTCTKYGQLCYAQSKNC